MIRRCKEFVIYFAAAALSCTPLTPDRDRQVDFPHPGMKKVFSAGKSFNQGWNDFRASYDEKPGMKSAFTYDYWLDTTEVTQKQYNDITGKQPVVTGSPYGAGDNYPVYKVSWFDAVLYCNMRSQAEGLDTVYVYYGIKTLMNGTVYDLTGLRYDLTRNGYRLPTEAEWEFAARGASSSLPFSTLSDSSYACYYAWHGENSSGTTHLVGTRLPNSLGLYDMAGNVFEWTNDWKCLYDGQNITNSLGALQPGSEYEKVIKGGSYNYSMMYLRPSHRSATYATEVSSANEYVGFRCAIGVISNGQYTGIGQTAFVFNPVNIMTNASDLRSSTGTSGARIVVVNVTGSNRTLCYVDFSRAFPTVWEFFDDKNIYMPTISPDGWYVAYCSRNEGQTGPSRITIRSLKSLNSPKIQLAADSAYIPRWWVDRQSGMDTFLIYTNSSCDNNSGSLLWPMTKTYRQKMSGGKPVGVPFELISDGSYHDGISADGQYAVSGFSRLLRRDIFTGVDTQLFVSPENGKDKDAEGSTRVCNVSMSPDTGSGARCMFLDFGYTGISTVTGTSYGIHQYLFVSNMSGVITNFIHFPSEEQSWDYPEWSNKSQFTVACGRNSTEQAHAIYVIDLGKKSFKQVVTGVELQQPYLWTGIILDDAYLDRDSLGQYNDPPNGQECFAAKFLWFWKVFDSIEVAVTGSSQAMNGLDPSKFTGGLNTFNFAANSCDLAGQKTIIQNYITTHSSNIKVICSSLDIGWLGTPDGNFSWEVGVGQSKGYLYDSRHAFWSGGVSSVFKDIVRQISLPDLNFDMMNLGFKGLSPLGWGTNPPSYTNVLYFDSDRHKNLEAIAIVAELLRVRGIHWIMINFPESPNYRGTDHYGCFGPSLQIAHEIIDKLQELERSNTFFHFYNANMDGNHDYIYQDFYDEHHLSAQGAQKLSVRVDSIIHTLLP